MHEQRLYDIQLRLWRIEQKLDHLLEHAHDPNNQRLDVLTKKLNETTAGLDKAVEAASKVIPLPVA